MRKIAMVFKNKTQGRYVNVSKGILENKSLSLRDRGMLVTLLSLPDNWDFSIAGLTKILPDGKSSVSASLDRLIQLGYVIKKQERTSLGKFGINIIEVNETPKFQVGKPSSNRPLAENRVTDNLLTEKPTAENKSQLSNKEVNSNKVINNRVIRKESETLSDRDYEELAARFGRDVVDYQINKIKMKHYRGCLNKSTIEKWCEDYQTNVTPPRKVINNFNNFQQRNYDYDKLEQALISAQRRVNKEDM
jgi:hypothetical protein